MVTLTEERHRVGPHRTRRAGRLQARVSRYKLKHGYLYVDGHTGQAARFNALPLPPSDASCFKIAARFVASSLKINSFFISCQSVSRSDAYESGVFGVTTHYFDAPLTLESSLYLPAYRVRCGPTLRLGVHERFFLVAATGLPLNF